jgi:membrane associated rhomboid family serine protease/Zn-finger nucleic acid-binding protein
MRPRCPTCPKFLELVNIPGYGFYHRCLDHGAWLGFGLLAKFKKGADFLNRLKNFSPRNSVSQKIFCPVCRRQMQTMDFANVNRMEVDLCQPCRGIWFDSGEVEVGSAKIEFPVAEYEPKPDIEAQKMNWPSEEVLKSPGSQHYSLLHEFGLPTEEEAVVPWRQPHATWSLLAVCLFFTLSLLHSPARWVPYVFNTAIPMAHYGLTWFTSLFLHAGFGHLIGNGYMLLICGDNVEDEVGPAGLLVLFFLSGFMGHFVTMVMSHGMITLGASGAISGIIAYYAFAFPRNRFAMTWRVGWGIGRRQRFSFSLSPLELLILNVMKDLVGAYLGKAGATPLVNHWAHLGGVAAGIIFYSIYGKPIRYREKVL